MTFLRHPSQYQNVTQTELPNGTNKSLSKSVKFFFTCPHFVVIGQLLDLVRAEAEPEDRLGDEGVVEPLQLIVGHVEPLEVVLAHQQPVDVLQLIVIQTQSLQNLKYCETRL